MDDVERDDLMREALTLLKAAASTADRQKAEELRERAHVLFVLIDALLIVRREAPCEGSVGPPALQPIPAARSGHSNAL